MELPSIVSISITIPLTNHSVAIIISTTIIPAILTIFWYYIPTIALGTNSPLAGIIRGTISYLLDSNVTLCIFITISTYGVDSKDITGSVGSRFDVEVTVSCTYNGEEATGITLVPVREHIVLCTIKSFLTVGVPDSILAVTLTLNKVLRAIFGYEAGGCCSNNAREEQRQESCNFFHLVLLKYMVYKILCLLSRAVR